MRRTELARWSRGSISCGIVLMTWRVNDRRGANGRFGSKAYIPGCPADVRFAPESRHWATPVTMGRRTNYEWQGDSVCGGCAPREHVLDRAGATELLHWESCRLAAHG